jgi:hypothetical protein
MVTPAMAADYDVVINNGGWEWKGGLFAYTVNAAGRYRQDLGRQLAADHGPGLGLS